MSVFYCQKMLNLVGCSIDCTNMKTILRHLIILALFACALSISASAQGGSSLTLDGSSFRLEQTDALGGVNIDPIGKDRSNRACFRLKISLNRMTPEDIAKVSVVPVGGNIVLMRSEVAASQNGIIVEMTARPEVRLYIKHPTLGQSNVVTINPEGNKVYLLSGWADQRLSIVVFCAKSGAEVWLDGTYRGNIGSDNVLNITDVTTGPHTLKVKSADDMSEQQINVVPGKISFNVELKSAALLQQFLVFNVTPPDALVMLGDEHLIPEAGIARKRVKFGTYDYTVSAKDYYSVSGTVTVNDPKTRKDVRIVLKPAHGWISVDSPTSVGAYVYVDDELIGQVPLKTDRIASGTYTLKVVKPKYRSYNTKVTVSDGQVTEISPLLQADFASVTLNVADDAEIWIDGELKGIGTWNGELASGAYLVECRKENHRQSSDNLTVSPDMPSKVITLTAPTPIYGSLSISASPDDAAAYLDEKYIGQTPLYLPQTLIGTHTLILRKPGCADWIGNIAVSEDQIAEVNAVLQSAAPVTFTCGTSGAQLYVDGVLLGSANGTYDLSFGTHNVICKASGKKDFSKTINVTVAGGDRKVECSFASPHAFNSETITVNGVSFDMIKVEGGTFTMGATYEQGSDAESDEKPVHQVTLSDFYIGETEVTQALWKAVMGTNPSRFNGDNNPVEKVSWNDCQEFIRKLNSLTGRTFRLPTEAEWEYAARGGNKTKKYKYSGSNNIDNVAWYSDNSSSKAHPVKMKSPNELGLYDMSGNVWEWCSDWYGIYSTSVQTNPKGPYSGSRRVLRGGGWNTYVELCRVSPRISASPDNRDSSSGLRLVLDSNKSAHTTSSQSVLLMESPSNQPYRLTINVKGQVFDMIMVKGGTFTMGATSEQGGDAYSGEKPTHIVALSDYYIGQTEVTQALWKAVMGTNPSRFYGDSNPVDRVSWNDCQEFIHKLNSLTGRTFRMPTEAEWEYAARGGNNSKKYKYSGSSNINNVAWYHDNSGSKTHAVKMKSPNELGLYDMSGNVYEWCSDWSGSYSSSYQTNPNGPTRGSNRILRGGSWDSGERYCRVSLRQNMSPDYKGNIGLRLVLVP